MGLTLPFMRHNSPPIPCGYVPLCKRTCHCFSAESPCPYTAQIVLRIAEDMQSDESCKCTRLCQSAHEKQVHNQWLVGS